MKNTTVPFLIQLKEVVKEVVRRVEKAEKEAIEAKERADKAIELRIALRGTPKTEYIIDQMIIEERAKKSGREIPSSEREAILTLELSEPLEQLKEMVKEAVGRVEKAEKEVSEANIKANVAITIRKYLDESLDHIPTDEWIETEIKRNSQFRKGSYPNGSSRIARLLENVKLIPELSNELEQLKEMIKEVVRRTEKAEKEANEAKTKAELAIELRESLSSDLD